MPESTALGRWTIIRRRDLEHDDGHLLPSRAHVPEADDLFEVIPVVPCNEAAVERVAKELANWEIPGWLRDDRAVLLDMARDCLRAAGGRRLMEKHGPYVCPNGHEFRWPQAIPCDCCDASVVMVPTSEVYRLREALALAARHLRFSSPETPNPAHDAEVRQIMQAVNGAR